MSFDVDSFLNTEVTGSLDTQFKAVPQGYYKAVVTDKFEMSEFKSRKGDTLCKLTMYWKPLHPALAKILGREGATVKQDIFLDVVRDAAGKARGLEVGSGKNIGLGRVREALGQNDGGPWNFRRMVGKMAFIRVDHRKSDQGGIFDEVKAVYKDLPKGTPEGPMREEA